MMEWHASMVLKLYAMPRSRCDSYTKGQTEFDSMKDPLQRGTDCHESISRGSEKRTPSMELAASVRDDYSAWLDAIFPPSGQNNCASSSRPEDKLPSIASTDPVGDDLSPDDVSCPKRVTGCDGKSIVVAPKATGCRRREQRRLRKSRGGPSERSFPGHHSTPHDNLTRAGSLPHPATFQDARYGPESSFWPGVSFFEHIPARTKIRIATTLVVQGPQGAARTGGEVIWIRSDDRTGRLKRRIFPTAEALMACPKLWKRVMESLAGQDKQPRKQVLSTTRDKRGESLGGSEDLEGSRRTRAGAGMTQSRCLQHEATRPTALVKYPGTRDGTTCPSNGSDVFLVNSDREISSLLLREAEGRCGSHASRGTTDSRRSGRGTTIVGHLAGNHRDSKAPPIGGEVMPTYAALPSAAPAIGLNKFLETGTRSRPWVIQTFVKPKGPFAWIVRAVWKKDRDPYCWILSDSDPFVTRGVLRGGATHEKARTAVRSAGKDGWRAPKAIVAHLARTFASALPIRLGELAVDLIEDETGKWWLTQVKAFRLLPLSAEVSLPSTSSRQMYKGIVSERTCCPGRYCGGGVNRKSDATMLSSGAPEDVVTSRRDHDDYQESTTGDHHPASVASSTRDERNVSLDKPGLELPLKALVMHERIADFREEIRLPLQAGGGGKMEASWKVCRRASLLEAAATQGLPRRDQVLLYDCVQLCAACFRVYSESWRWWLDHVAKVTRDMGPVRVRTGKDHRIMAEGGARRHRRPMDAPVVDTGAQDCAELGTPGSSSPTRQPDSHASLSQWLPKNLKTGPLAAMDANDDSNGKGDNTPESKHLEIHHTTPPIRTPTPPPPTSSTTGGVVAKVVYRSFQARGGRSSFPSSQAQRDHAPVHGGSFRTHGGAGNGDRPPSLGQWLDNLESKYRCDERPQKPTDEGTVEGHEDLVFATGTGATREIVGIDPHGSNEPQRKDQYQHPHQHQQQRLEGRAGDQGAPEDETSITLEDPRDANLVLGGTATSRGGRSCSRSSRHGLSVPGDDVEEGAWKWEGVTVNWDEVREKAADGIRAS